MGFNSAFKGLNQRFMRFHMKEQLLELLSHPVMWASCVEGFSLRTGQIWHKKFLHGAEI